MTVPKWGTPAGGEAPASPPSARQAHVAYDPIRSRVVEYHAVVPCLCGATFPGAADTPGEAVTIAWAKWRTHKDEAEKREARS